jgi:hypothetical protein
MSFRTFASLAFATAVTASTVAEDPILLRLRFSPGETLRQRITQVQTMDMGPMGSTETTTAFVLRQGVEKVAEDGTATLAVRYEAIRMDVQGPMSMSYDSTLEGEAAKANSEDLAAMFEPMLEAELRMKFEPSGRVKEIEGFDQLFDGLEEVAGESGSAMKKMFDEESLRRLVEVNVFPDEPLEPGATWKRGFDQGLLQFGSLKFEFESTFAGVETKSGARCAKILVAGKTSFAKGEASAIDMEIDDGEIDGEMWFSLEQGRFLEASLNLDGIVMRMSAPGLDETITMEMSTETRTVLLGKDEPAFGD